MAQNKVTKTLLYSDIFDFPLTLPEIHKYLITDKKISMREVSDLLNKSNEIRNKNGFYFLQGRSKLVLLRKERHKKSAKKIRSAFKIAKILRFIPTINLLGISGSVSMGNAEEKEDIDLFVITSKGTLWSTRFLIICLLILNGVHRKKYDKNPANKFCLNMIMDEGNLILPENRRDIYSAHEIIQIFPLFERKNTFEKFIANNSWVKKYLSNFEPNPVLNENIIPATGFIWKVLEFFMFEKFIKFIQIKYMGKPRGNETIGEKFLAFHPEDPRKQIVKIFKKKLKSPNFITLGH